jgi:DNA-binding transcriptional ArsR family regulator
VVNLPPALHAARPIESDNDPTPAAVVFRALGHPSRLRLLRVLMNANRPVSPARLRECVTQGVAAEHVKVLQAAGLIEVVGQGRDSRWQLVPGALAKVQRLLLPDRVTKPQHENREPQ